MSIERAWVVALARTAARERLVDDIRAALNRGHKADPGDRSDIVRFEALMTRLEHDALSVRDAPRTAVARPTADCLLIGPDPQLWPDTLPTDVRDAALAAVRDGDLPVVVVDPFGGGRTAENDNIADIADIAADPPAARWDADGERGRQAVISRLRAQIEHAVNPAEHGGTISPSGITNAVLTELLREFAAAVPGKVRVDVPVEYRDGSRSAHPFPLRALPLRENLPAASLQLRFALLSIRHTEMDAVVDGAWLRNAEISRPRPAAQTDDLVHDISCRQLAQLCHGERHVRLYLYQTGLETAVVGFYRALLTHLIRFPRSVSVQPMYFERPPRKGKGSHPVTGALTTDSSFFRKGTAWTM